MGQQAIGALTRIVVGVDFTRTGDHALCHAMQLAQMAPNSELHVTFVIESDRDVHSADKLDALSSELQEKLADLRERVEFTCAPHEGAASFGQDIVFHVRIGSPAEALHQVAVDVDADVIVVGTHGRTGVEKLLLGSVAEKLIRIAHLPVLIARPKEVASMRKSDRPDPARPGEDLHAGSLVHRARVELTPRTPHISGLI
jgi:nucleotide-binding universal stress UspA family protein